MAGAAFVFGRSSSPAGGSGKPAAELTSAEKKYCDAWLEGWSDKFESSGFDDPVSLAPTPELRTAWRTVESASNDDPTATPDEVLAYFKPAVDKTHELCGGPTFEEFAPLLRKEMDDNVDEQTCKVEARTVKTAIQAYKASEGEYPTSFDSLDGYLESEPTYVSITYNGPDVSPDLEWTDKCAGASGLPDTP